MRLDPVEKDITLTYSSRTLLSDVARFIAPYKGRFLLATAGRLVGDIVWLYPPLALATIVTFFSTYEQGQDASTVWLALTLWAAALLVRAVGHFVAKHEGFKLAERVALDSSLKTMRHLFLLDMRWHERENSGNKLKRISNAGSALNSVVRIWVNNVIEIAVNLIGVSIILISIDTTVLILLASFAVSFLFISTVLTRRAAEATYRVNEQEEQVQGLQFESVNNIRSVKVMGITGALNRMIMDATETLFGRIKTRVWRFQSRNMLLYIWGYGFNIAILAFIAWGIVEGRYELGLFVLFHAYFGRIWESVSELSSIIQDFVTAKYSIARMQAILDEPIATDAGKAGMPENWKEISFEDVSFTYGGEAVLSNISFSITRGEKVGIVGLSGAGKSTLFKLLLKEREEYTGTIRVDGVPLKDINRAEYFARVSAVLQDTEVFNLSLSENIRIARTSDDDAAFDAALQISHVNDFLHKLPEGVDTRIGEKGIKLSGGERQRLGIARSVYKQPELLLLDEATSHLDLESEEKIQDSLHQFFETVTAVVIAHRLTTIREMDKILVLEEGRILEEGSFDELQAKRGRFFELWEKQRL